MANLDITVRTNYFRVTDKNRFRQLFDRVISEDDIQIWESEYEPDKLAFGTYGAIVGLLDTDDEITDTSYEYLLIELQKLIVPGDACIITTVGNCKLRCVLADTIIITHNKIDSITLETAALEKARSLLETENWETVFDE